jgi:glycogen(starch) synthase
MQEFRIALTGGYPPPFGGVSTSVMQLAEQLVKEERSVRVFALNDFQSEVPEYVCRHRPNSIDVSHNLFFKMREFGPDIIHSHQSTLDWRMGFFSTILGTPIIHHVYGERFPDQYTHKSLIKRSLIRLFAKSSAAVIAVSSDLADLFATLGVENHRIYVIPCLLPLEENLIPTDTAASSSEEYVIVTTGFYPFANPHYGFHLVPPVARKLKRNDVRFKWYLVGQASKPEMDAFHDLLVNNGVQNYVEFIGEMGRPQMLDLLKKAHIYVRTKYSDSFGIVIAEAHQLGCYCLFGDNNPYFEDGPRLTKYRTGDVESLTSKLLEIIQQMSLDKPQYVESPFATEAEANYEAIKQVYEDVIAGRL